MSKLNVDQKSILSLLEDKRSDFLIPDYQRPYAWGEEQCQTLWDDIFAFSFPNNDYNEFLENEEYFLGSIVTFKNDDGKLEVIDGQQRLTTLMLLLRAFYDKFEHMQDQNSKLTRERIEKCIWKTDTFGKADKDSLKIDSEVATDSDKDEFLELLRTGIVPEKSRSQYVNNFKFFQTKIDEFLNTYPAFFAYLPARILNNCILLPIEAESQDTALRIFTTLNNRGLPLSDAAIFKAQFYKHYSNSDKKDWFIEEWRGLEDITSKIFNPPSGAPMDELFTRYMYYLRAKEGNKRTSTEALRKFYERNKYKYFKDDYILDDLKSLALFWENVARQNKDNFSEEILKKLFVLKAAPNGMWEFITSVYFLTNKAEDGHLDDIKFSSFLDKITAFIFAYAVTNPGVNALRAPVYTEMINIINGNEVTFSEWKFNRVQITNFLENYKFTNQRPITRSLLTWHVFTYENQVLLDLRETFEIEHIFSKKRQQMEQGLSNNDNIESLGNKILLEKSINIKAADYRFEDKKRIYSGEIRRGKNKEASKVTEVMTDIIGRNAFEEDDIVERRRIILEKFLKLLEKENLFA